MLTQALNSNRLPLTTSFNKMSKPNKELLEELMALTIEELIATIKGGEANPATLNVARQMLRDNQITCTRAEPVPSMVWLRQ